MAKIDTIIFDLGGVLIDWNPRYLYRKIFDTEAEVDWFLENICTSDWNEAQDGGRTWEEGVRLLTAQYPEWSEQIRAFHERWEEMLGGAISGTVEILRKLTQHPEYKVVALTNWSAETFPIALERYDFLQWFEGILVSGEEKTRKPFPEIYELILSKYGIDRSRAIFIDDNARNVAASQAVGIEAIRFKSPEDLQMQLTEHGVVLNV